GDLPGNDEPRLDDGVCERGTGRRRGRPDGDTAAACARVRQEREDHSCREPATTHRGPLSTTACKTRAVPPSLIRILDARGASRLALSPDAGTLYYVSDLTGTMQLWSVAVAGGVPRRLSYEADRVGAYGLSPNGTKIAYGADEGGDERWALWVMNADGTQARRVSTRAARIHHVVDWTADGRGVPVFATWQRSRGSASTARSAISSRPPTRSSMSSRSRRDGSRTPSTWMDAPRSGSFPAERTRRSPAFRRATSRPISSATASRSQRTARSRWRGRVSTPRRPSTWPGPASPRRSSSRPRWPAFRPTGYLKTSSSLGCRSMV